MNTIIIDGQELSFTEGETVLQVAQKNGINIPALCYHPALEPYGACRVCLVEVSKKSWGDWSKLVVSCAYPAEGGLIVSTKSEKVILSRKFVIELLLAKNPEAEAVIKLAAEYGIEKARPDFVKSAKSGQERARLKKCILCGLCVRVCADVIGQSALTFINRGRLREVEAPFKKASEDCIGCGACYMVCPTGAITLEDIEGRRKVDVSRAEKELIKCKGCGEFFITGEVFKKIVDRGLIEAQAADACPACRRKTQAKNLMI